MSNPSHQHPKPNLFRFATRELSQDAILCWLLAWADSKHEAQSQSLHQVGVDLLALMHRKAKATFTKPGGVEIRRQAGNIDILCILDEKTAIIVEDKVGTKQHSGQLPKYLKYVEEELGFAPERIIGVYVQTGDQGDYREVEQHKFAVLKRGDLLEVLESEHARPARESSDILTDFAAYLRGIEDDVQSFRALPLAIWKPSKASKSLSNAWRGFYSYLQTLLEGAQWDYVSNPSKGFIGLWWDARTIRDGGAYLQLEEDRLCFKIMATGKAGRGELRQRWSQAILAAAAARGIAVRRPIRFGDGTYMTVAVLSEDYRKPNADGMIDLEATLATIREAEVVLGACAKDFSAEAAWILWCHDLPRGRSRANYAASEVPPVAFVANISLKTFVGCGG